MSEEAAVQEVLTAEELRAKEAAEKADAEKAAQARARVVAAKMAKLPPMKLKLYGGDWLDVQKKPRHQKAYVPPTPSRSASTGWMGLSGLTPRADSQG